MSRLSDAGSIEEIILCHQGEGRKKSIEGMAQLIPFLASDFCSLSARFLYNQPGSVMIVTGFYEPVPETIETDGPPGAIAIGNALKKLDRKVVYVSDKYTVGYLKALGESQDVIEYPITDHDASKEFADELLSTYNPGMVIAIERCSLTADGHYYNMSGQNLSNFTAKTDYLFMQHQNTIGIGDGGNEIGMGNLHDVITTIPSLPTKPSVTRTSHLIISSVSNWAGYGLAAALSLVAGEDLTTTRAEAKAVITGMTDLGAVDGELLEPIPWVDGFSLEENLEVVDRLREFVNTTLGRI